jgi:hypothetical protein
MKLQPLDHKVQTNCKDCAFSIYNDKTQIGCEAGRVDIFKDQKKIVEAYDDEKEFYVVKGFCNLYRDSQWNSGTPDISKALSEVSPTFELYIDCDNIEEENVPSVLQFIQGATYPRDKYIITLYQNHSTATDKRKKVVDIYRKSNNSIFISSCDNKDLYLHEKAVKTKMSYIINLTCDNINNQFMDKIHHSMNFDLKQPLISKFENNYAFSSTAYKVEASYSNSISFSENTNSLINKTKETKLFVEI